MRSFDLSKKKGKEWHVEPICENGEVRFEVAPGKAEREGTVNRRGATCVHCGSPIDFPYIRAEGRANRMGACLMAIVAEGVSGRAYVPPTARHISAASVERPVDYPDAKIAVNPRDFKTPNYGLEHLSDLFTNRQLTALTTFSALVKEAQQKAYEDAVAAGMPDDGIGLADCGTGSLAYGQAVGVYLAFLVDQLANHCSSICSWHAGNAQLRNVFARQAIPMTWDYAESNPFCCSTGSYHNLIDREIKAFSGLPMRAERGVARQFDAQSDSGLDSVMVSADPPYYDNIGYADLSDYFYVWLRQSLRGTYPQLFSTMLVPKKEELVATPYRFDGSKQRAKEFFEDGMLEVFRRVFDCSRGDIPVTIYYAFKQNETEVTKNGERTASTGWETMLGAMVRAGFAITGTWPVRTEMENRAIGNGTNALASSIVLVCRKRAADAPLATRREFVNALKRELHPALDALQTSNIAPVDLAQSAIGPGMGVFSRYAKVLEADGSEMSVRSALQIINQELDSYFSDQDGELDRESRFCVELYTQYAFNDVKFGEADVLARAKNTSIEGIASKGALFAEKGMVHLRTREELSSAQASAAPMTWMLAQRLTHALATGGIEECAKVVNDSPGINVDGAKALAYRLFTIADKKKWNEEAFAYNSLVTAWEEIQNKAAQLAAVRPVQGSLFE